MTNTWPLATLIEIEKQQPLKFTLRLELSPLRTHMVTDGRATPKWRVGQWSDIVSI